MPDLEGNPDIFDGILKADDIDEDEYCSASVMRPKDLESHGPDPVEHDRGKLTHLQRGGFNRWNFKRKGRKG